MDEVRGNIAELRQLVQSAGAEVAAETIQQRTRIDGSTFIGEGKLEKIGALIPEEGVNLVVFDDELSPAQARNIEAVLGVNVIDRTELILDIFSRRARTKQAKIQVEIAQLTYALPRLRRLWEHLSRQAGGIGTRGPGETQLEVDRRRVRERISHLKKELSAIDRRAGERRKKRREAFNVTLVGYTNAGKSSLLNRLSGSGVLESSLLFSTLDSTSRRVDIPGYGEIVLTDTVGFIRKLPTHLVASFRATLVDVEEADMLLHLVDAAAPGADARIEVVNSVLESVLGEHSPGNAIPTLLAFNKTDLIEDPAAAFKISKNHPGAVLISAETGEGLEALSEAIRAEIGRERLEVTITVPAGDGRAIETVERHAVVRSRRVDGEYLIFSATVRKKDIGKLESSGAVQVVRGAKKGR